MTAPIMEAIEGIGRSFEEFKRVNDQKLLEEAAGNVARAKELQAAVDKIGEELSAHQSTKEVLEKRLAAQAERVEILEALNDRPRATVEDKINNEHKELTLRWIRSKGLDRSAEDQYNQLVEKSRGMKNVVIGTNASGGFALPKEISSAINNQVLAMSDILQNVKVVQVGTSDYQELVSVNAANAAWSTETGTRSATNSPELRNRKPTWGELYSKPSASNWSLEDIFFNVEQWLVDNVSDSFAQAISTSIFSGSGSGQMTGITNTAPVTTNDGSPERSHEAIEYIPITSPSSPYTSSGVTADSLIDLVNLVRQPYHAGAKFAMNRATRGHVRKLKDSYGQYLWQPSFQAGLPDQLLGYPIFVWEDLGAATTADAYPVVFGDFKRAYTVAERSGMSIVRDPYSTSGYTAFYVAKRMGGILTNNDAIKCIKVAVS